MSNQIMQRGETVVFTHLVLFLFLCVEVVVVVGTGPSDKSYPTGRLRLTQTTNSESTTLNDNPLNKIGHITHSERSPTNTFRTTAKLTKVN